MFQSRSEILKVIEKTESLSANGWQLRPWLPCLGCSIVAGSYLQTHLFMKVGNSGDGQKRSDFLDLLAVRSAPIELGLLTQIRNS